MNDFYSVLAIGGELSEWMDDPATPFLKYTGLSWEEAAQIGRLSFRQGFRCVLWQTGAIDTGGREDAEKKGGKEL